MRFANAEKARATTKMVTLIVIYSLCSSSLLIINKVQPQPFHQICAELVQVLASFWSWRCLAALQHRRQSICI